MPDLRFSLISRAEGGHTIRLVLAGELDLAGRARLAQALDDAQDDVTDVVLDLQSLTTIDASCLAVVFAAAARSRRDDGMLILLEPLAQVRRVLDLIGAPDGVVVMDRSDGVFRAFAA